MEFLYIENNIFDRNLLLIERSRRGKQTSKPNAIILSSYLFFNNIKRNNIKKWERDK